MTETRQTRSQKTQSTLVDAAVSIIAGEGVARLTHRRLAAVAGTSLASTTYYFGSKGDILSAASQQSLAVFSKLIRDAATSSAASGPSAFSGFEAAFLDRVLSDHRQDAAAWAELFLNAAKHAPSAERSRIWQNDIHASLATLLPKMPPSDISAALDRAIGVLFVTQALGLNRESAMRVIADGHTPEAEWGLNGEAQGLGTDPAPKSAKARQTRDRLISAATDLLLQDGPGAIGFRQVARRADLAATAPAYHFDSVNQLTYAACRHLTYAQRARFEDTYAKARSACVGSDDLGDFLAIVLQRELQGFGHQNRAGLEIWLEALRQPHLVDLVQTSVAFHCKSWDRMVTRAGASIHANGPFAAYCGFIGQMARMLAIRARDTDLIGARDRFARTLATI